MVPELYRSPQLKPQPPKGDTDPAIKLERIYSDHKKAARRKPWYAAGVSAVLLAAAGAIGKGVAVHQDSEKEDKTVIEYRLEAEKAAREDAVAELKAANERHDREHRRFDRRLTRLLVQNSLLLDAARVPRSKRPAEDEEEDEP